MNTFIIDRSGDEEEVDEACSLLQEILDLMEAGVEIVNQKKADKKAAEKEAKKKISLLKSGKDIRLKAMQTLKGNVKI